MGSVKRSRTSGIWYILTVSCCFLVGGVLGSFLGMCTGGSGAAEIDLFLHDFLTLAGTREVIWSVPAVLWHRGRWLLCCCILGLSSLGIVFLPVLFGLRGFLLAFGASCFVQVFGAMGLIPAVLLFGIPALLWTPGFLVCGVVCLRRSLQTVGKVEPLPVGDLRSGMCTAGFFLVLCVMFECGLLPGLLSAAARILE